MVLKADKKLSDEAKIHPRNYNLPLCSEVAILVPIGQKINYLDIQLFSKSGEIRRIPLQNCHYDTLMYPLLHLHGEAGWNHTMTNITPLKHHKYVLQLREKKKSQELFFCHQVLGAPQDTMTNATKKHWQLEQSLEPLIYF